MGKKPDGRLGASPLYQPRTVTKTKMPSIKLNQNEELVESQRTKEIASRRRTHRQYRRPICVSSLRFVTKEVSNGSRFGEVGTRGTVMRVAWLWKGSVRKGDFCRLLGCVWEKR